MSFARHPDKLVLAVSSMSSLEKMTPRGVKQLQEHHVTYVSTTRGWKLNQRRGDASRRITDSEDALPVPVAWARA